MLALWLLGPGVLAALYYFRLVKRPLTALPFLGAVVAFSFLIALILTGIYFLHGRGEREYTYMFSTINTLTKYGALSLVPTLALPNIAYLLDKLFSGKKHEK